MAFLKTVKIHKKTLFTTAAGTAIFLGVIFSASWVAVMGGFLGLETISVQRNIERSQEVIAEKLNNLAVKLADWAKWDDTYVFIEDKNEAYVRANLTSTAIDTLQIDIMLFFNSRDEIVYELCHDHDKKTEHPLSGEFKKQLGPLLAHKDAESSVTGIMMLPAGPMLVASNPIIKSNGEGPVRGTMIFAAYLNAEMLKRFSQIVRAEISLKKMDDIFPPPDFAAARAAFLKGKETFIERLDAKTVAGYSTLKDLSGKEVLILKVMMSREITQFGKRTLIYFFVALIVVGFIFGAMVYVPLEREIFRRDRAEEAAGKSEKKFQNLIETSFDWIWECDENGIYTYVSPRIKDLLGYEAAEILGKTPFDFMPEEESVRIKKAFGEKFANKEAFRGLENANRHKDGHLVILETSGVPIIDEGGRVKGYRGTNRDITERKRAEEAQRESEKRFMDVLYASSDAILLIDGGKYVDCNEATARMLGYPARKEFLRASPAELSPPEQPDGGSSSEKADEMMRLAFEQGFHRFEWVHKKANGENFPVEVSLTPIFLQGKNILYCVWRDITEYKQLEKETRKHLQELEVFYKASVGREERILELKKEIEQLKRERGE